MSDPFTDKVKIPILLHGYNALWQEIRTRTSSGYRLFAVYAALFVWIIQANRAECSLVAFDNAGIDQTWYSGGNAGFGFASWQFSETVNDGNQNGFFTWNSLIDDGGWSWGVYANSGQTASAFRPFTGGPLSSGEHFSVLLLNNAVQTGGVVGLSLQDSAQENRFEFYYTGGNANYTINVWDAMHNPHEYDTGVPFTTNGLKVIFDQYDNNQFSVEITPLGGNATVLSGVLAASDITAARLFNYNAGAGAPYDFYFNDIQIYALDPPAPQSPGTSTDTGYAITTVTPTFSWTGVAGATRYGFYISQYPYGSANIVYSNTTLLGTSFQIPSGFLQNNTKYRWNMTSFDDAGDEGNVSALLYFQISGAQAAPVITAQPQSQTAQVGSNVSFTVTASGSPSPNYQWQFNGSPITGQTAATCSINDVQLSNSGNYSVTISNIYGSVNSAAALLTVYANLVFTQTNRVPTTPEIAAAIFLPSQLEVYEAGSFSTIGDVDTNAMTIILTHGWIPLKFWELDLFPVFTPNGVEDWPTTMAAELRAQGIQANIMAWNWESAASTALNNPGLAGSRTPGQGILLGQALTNVLGANYSKPIHFIGHSFGTLVNSYAANFLQGTNFANGQDVSSTPWPATNMQMTLFDEAEVGADANFNLDFAGLEALANLNAGFFDASSYYHPLPRQFAWADNYVSAFGLLKTNAANVILTDGFPTNASDLIHWYIQLGHFHGYPCYWYSNTIQNDAISAMGFQWSFEQGGLFSQAPTNGSVYVQFDVNHPWNLTQKDWNYGTNYLNSNFQEYGAVAESTAQIVGNIIDTSEQIPEFALFGVDGELLMSLNTTSENSAQSQLKIQPLGLSGNDQNNGSTNVPAYAWMQLVVPTNAVSLSFNYFIQGDWQSDSLAAAFNGTNVLLLAGSEIQTNVTFSSGSIDVSAYAGQTNEFFLGIVGGTSTDAQLTVENLVFSISLPPLLQAQVSAGNLFVLSWPMSEQNYNLQTTTNLVDPNSWTTLTNVPAIVNLQNTITNQISGGAGFYRLMQ